MLEKNVLAATAARSSPFFIAVTLLRNETVRWPRNNDRRTVPGTDRAAHANATHLRQ
jgi:hypothetical protein